MRKNIYLSHKEQEVFNIIKNKDIISGGEIKNLFPKMKAKNKLIHILIKKGYLYKLKRENYLVCENKTLIIKDPFKIANFLFEGYLAFSSALKVYGLLDYEPFTIFVITTNKSKTITIKNYEFKSVAFGRKAVGQTFYKNLYISTIEKTFFDCFCKPSFCSYSETTKALFQTKINWKEFLKYFQMFASSSLCQRTGYVLETMKKETKYKIPKYVIEFFRLKIKTKTRLLPNFKTSGKFIKEWMVQDNLGKKNFLSWWLHG